MAAVAAYVRPTGGKPRTTRCTQELELSVGPSGTAPGSRVGLRDALWYVKMTNPVRITHSTSQVGVPSTPLT